MLFKVFLQELWQRKLHWDKSLPDDLREQWLTILLVIFDHATSFQFARHYLNSDAVFRQLHVFVDASKNGYGAVTYLCLDRQSSLVLSKTQVAPIKELTLPKLELMAAVIGTRLLKFLLDSLSPLWTEIPIYMWSDSQIVLYWIHSSKHLPQFVSHCVTEIQESLPSTSCNTVRPMTIQLTSSQEDSQMNNLMLTSTSGCMVQLGFMTNTSGPHGIILQFHTYML